MKADSVLQNSWRFYFVVIALGCFVAIASGVGAYVGNRLADKPSFNGPLALHAATAARGKSISMATGLIDGNVEGLFILDHTSGELQCWIVSPRTGQVGGIYRANVAVDFGLDKAGDADYVLTTGNYNFLGQDNGNLAPGNSICYVADSKSGKVIGYAMFYDKPAINRGVQTNGPLKPICTGTLRGEGSIRNQ
ncbi:MAG: hypothetical protein AAF939_18910 [Planctomycetota bacterium]